MEKNRESMVTLLSLFVLAIAGTAEHARAQTFVPGCTLPFDAIKLHHPVDDSCWARGDVPNPPVGSNDAGHALQNEAKNNFRASGAPVRVTFASFVKLQQKLHQKIPAAKMWNREHLPADRSGFAALYTTTGGDTIGEGSVVQFAGWVLKLRAGGAESVNCEGTKKDAIDLHLVLIANSDRENTPECSSVTAEISPHFRPDGWDAHAILLANDHPLRITGPLMYDASHRPCSGSPPKPGVSAPARVSSWEIHPVYGIDVCTKKSLRSCKPSDDTVWVPLDQWQGEEG
jgi:hypothetical protein